MQIPEQTAEFSTQPTQGNAMTTANTALSAHHEKVLSSIDADMLALANRIAASATPDDEARTEIAYAIARHLKLDWPSAVLARAS